MVAAFAQVAEKPHEPFLRLVEADEDQQAVPDRVTNLPATNRDSMIEHHLPLVRYVAGRMASHANAATLLDYDDLVGYGAEGLIDAVDTFDPSYNVRFSTWAVIHIRTTIQDALRNLDPLSRTVRSKGKEIERIQYALANANGSWPDDADVATEMGVSVQRLSCIRQEVNCRSVSLEQITAGKSEDSSDSVVDWLADPDPETNPEMRLDEAAFRMTLLEAVESLPERERFVVSRYYNKGDNMRTISDQLGISESRVSQLHARAITVLRGALQDVF